jgi:hypothetical protein
VFIIRYLLLEEVNKLLLDLELPEGSLIQRDINIQFNLAMMTNIHELESERHLRMSMPEFIDFLGRIADKVQVRTRRLH